MRLSKSQNTQIEEHFSSLKERGLVKPVRSGVAFFFSAVPPLLGALGKGGGVRDRPEADRVAAEGP
jgi:hypothetical protein